MTINSNPTGASITITNRAGTEVYKGGTPATVTLKSGAKFFKRELYKIHFQLTGYDVRDVPVECRVNGWYWGNCFRWNNSWLIVDPATGAMYKLDRDSVSETLAKTTGSIQTGHSLNVYSINEIPPNIREHLIKIN